MAEIPNRTLQRGFQMLELLGAHPDGLALCELGDRLVLARSTAFNLAHSLIELGYASLDEETGKYRLGLKMYEIGAQAVNRVDGMSLVRGCMTEIHRTINETVHLGVRSGTDTLYIDKLDSTQSIRMTSYIGSRAPLNCTALGKALLATLPDAEIRSLYAHTPLARVTPRSIGDMDTLLAQMAVVRANGYAVEREENNENVCCVAVALRGTDGRALYAMSVSAPIFRMGEAEIDRCAQLLSAAQRRLEPFVIRG